MTGFSWYSMESAIVLLNMAEKRGEWEKTFKGYGKDGVDFKTKLTRKDDLIEVYIDDKLIKKCSNEGEVLDLLSKKAEEF